MGRPGKFSVDCVLNAALEVLEAEGMRSLTMTRVCARLGAPSGSLYHRFASREDLVVELWLRCAERFQDGYYLALDSDSDPRMAAHYAVRYFVERARSHRAEALVLMAYRREDLIQGPWPTAVGQRARALDKGQQAAADRFAARLWPEGKPDLPRMHYALLGLPMAAALDELRSGHQNPQAIDWILTALDAILADCWQRLESRADAPR